MARVSQRETKRLPKVEWTPCAEFNAILDQYNDLDDDETATDLSRSLQFSVAVGENGGDIQLLLKALLTPAERRCFLGTLRLVSNKHKFRLTLNPDADTKVCDMLTLFVGLRRKMSRTGHQVVVVLYPKQQTGLFIDSNGSNRKFLGTTGDKWMSRIEGILLKHFKIAYKLKDVPDVCPRLPPGFARVDYAPRSGPQQMQTEDQRSTCWLWALLSLVLLHKCRPALSMPEIVEHWYGLSPERLTELLRRFGMWVDEQSGRHNVDSLVDIQDAVNKMSAKSPVRATIQQALDAFDFPRAFVAYAEASPSVDRPLVDAYLNTLSERDKEDQYRQLALDLEQFAEKHHLPAGRSPVEEIIQNWHQYTEVDHALVVRNKNRLSSGTTTTTKQYKKQKKQQHHQQAVQFDKMLSNDLTWRILQFLSISERLLKAERSSRRLLTVSRTSHAGLTPLPHVVELSSSNSQERRQTAHQQIFFWLNMLSLPFPMRVVSLDISNDLHGLPLFALGLYVFEHASSLQQLNVHRDIQTSDSVISSHRRPDTAVMLQLTMRHIDSIANKSRSRDVWKFWKERKQEAYKGEPDDTLDRALSSCQSLRRFLWQDEHNVFNIIQSPRFEWHKWSELREFQLSSGPVCKPSVLKDIAASCPYLEVLRLVAWPGKANLVTNRNQWYWYILPKEFVSRFAKTLKTLVLGQVLYVPERSSQDVSEDFFEPISRMVGLQKLGIYMRFNERRSVAGHVEDDFAKLIRSRTWPELNTLLYGVEYRDDLFGKLFGPYNPVWSALRAQESKTPLTLVLPPVFDAYARYEHGGADHRAMDATPTEWWFRLPNKLQEGWQKLFRSRQLKLLPWKASLDWKTWTIAPSRTSQQVVPMSDDLKSM